MMKSLQISIFEGHVSVAVMQPVAASGVTALMGRLWKTFLGQSMVQKQIASVSRSCASGDEMRCLQVALRDRALDARGLDAEILFGPALSMAFTLPAPTGVVNRQTLERAAEIWQSALPASLQTGWNVRCVHLANLILGCAIPSATMRELQTVLNQAGIRMRACIPGTAGICITPGLGDGVHAITEASTTYETGAPLELAVMQEGRLILVARYFTKADGPAQLRQNIEGFVHRIAAQCNCKTLELRCHGGLAADLGVGA